MATLNTSANGPQISSSYQKLVNAGPPSGPAANSPTYAQWALYSVQAPLTSAFQASSSSESVLKVQTTGEGELRDLIEDFSDGRIQFAFVKVKDPNTGLPKAVLIAWCGEGVPERTKGYFGSHMGAVAKLLHGYHVQVTARSEGDLSPEGIVQKVADSSGSKYSGGGDAPARGAGGPPPPMKSKPAMPTKSFGTAGFQPLSQRSRQAPTQDGNVDQDGWGDDAPQVTRSQLEKVESSYKPTKVDMGALQSQREPSRYQAPQQDSNGNPDVVRGGYQPIGKVDIASIRRQAQEQGSTKDDRPTVVKGAYEPIGKVDIAEIRRKAQGAPPPAQSSPPPQASQGEDERPKTLSERSAAFSSSSGNEGRLTSMPKPQVSNRFGSSNNFTGTKAPTPGQPSAPAAAPIGTASRTFADQGGKTPAQQWEEKRRARGLSGAGDTQQSGAQATSPVQSQPSGGWQSGYGGKKWGVQIPTRTGGSGVSAQRTGDEQTPPAIPEQQGPESLEPPSGGVGAIRDRFKDSAPMGAGNVGGEAPSPPPLDTSSKPNAGARGVPIPGLPQRPQQQEEEAEDVLAEEHQTLPPPPPRPMPTDEPEPEDEDLEPRGSPVRIAMPVGRGAPQAEEPAPMSPPESLPPRAMPTSSLEDAIASRRSPSPEPAEDPARGRGEAAAAAALGVGAGQEGEDVRDTQQGGKEAIAQYDYEKAEENELELHEGERIVNIDMVDEDWWMGQNSRGETGLFPSNYVEVVEGGSSSGAAPAMPPREDTPEPEPAAAASGGGAGGSGKTATAQYDYEAAEDNELSFPDGAKITDIEFPDEDWWFGHYGGRSGLFPANYVEVNP